MAPITRWRDAAHKCVHASREIDQMILLTASRYHVGYCAARNTPLKYPREARQRFLRNSRLVREFFHRFLIPGKFRKFNLHKKYIALSSLILSCRTVFPILIRYTCSCVTHRMYTLRLRKCGIGLIGC